MPHDIIEYSKMLKKNLPVKELLSVVHVGVLASGLFKEASIKTRVIEFVHHQTGLTNSPFIHITLKILHGRDHQKKR